MVLALDVSGAPDLMILSFCQALQDVQKSYDDDLERLNGENFENL